MKLSKMKRDQKYIVVCTNAITRSKAGLGSSGRFVPGEYITENGTPTSDPNARRKPAAVYVRGKDDFPFRDTWIYAYGYHGKKSDLLDYFEAVPVDVTIQPK